MFNFIKEQGVGFVLGILSTILYDYKIKSWITGYIRKKEIQKTHSINVLEEYKKRADIFPVISYGDSQAIEIEPLMQYGKAILIARIDISNRPRNYQNRDFVMVLLKYIPSENWNYYQELGYYFKFKIRGNIQGLQLEIKDTKGQKIIDKFIEVGDSFKEYKISLFNKKVDEISEICFTAFCEERYMIQDIGWFEIFDCIIHTE